MFMNITFEVNKKKNGYDIFNDGILICRQVEPNIPFRVLTDGITNYTESAKKHKESIESNPDFMTLSEYKTARMLEVQNKITEYRKHNPIKSSCHGGTEKIYAIDEQTQNLLMARVSTASMEPENLTSWMAYGEDCTYDWTLSELYQLSLEIESVMNPILTLANTFTNQILACTSKEQVKEIEIYF